MATDPEEPTETSMDHGVQKQSAPEEGSAFSNGAAAQLDEGDKKRKSLERPREPEEHSDKSYMTAISGPPPSGQIGGTGMSSQHTFGSSSYNIGQANGNGFLPGSMMMPPGSIAQNGGFSAAQFSAAQFSAAQNSMYSSPLATAGSGGHIIGEANLSAGMGMSMSMGSNAAVSHQLGISQMGSQGPYGTGAMSGSFGGSSGQLLGGYPGSSAKVAMPGEIMGTVTIPIYNTSPYPVPVTGSSQAGQQQYGNQNPGAAVGETEWHRSDGGAHNTHYMREGSSANNHGSVNMTHTNRQPLSEENALAMQRQDECLLAAQMSYVDLAEDQQLAGDDVGRTDSVRGVRGAMAPKHASAATLVGPQQ